MIAADTVIPIANGFYTVDKINSNQPIHGAEGMTFLTRIDYGREYGIIICTSHFEVIVTEDQMFITESGPKSAGELIPGDMLLTSNGYEIVMSISNTEEIYDMFFISTEDGTFQANGFYLTNDFRKDS